MTRPNWQKLLYRVRTVLLDLDTAESRGLAFIARVSLDQALRELGVKVPKRKSRLERARERREKERAKLNQ